MEFFKDFLKHLNEGEHINIAISKREGGKLVVSIAPVTVEKERTSIRPLLLRGDAADIDAKFFESFDALRKPVVETGIFSNTSAVVADRQEIDAEEEEKATKAAAAKTAKKAEKAKPAAAKKTEPAPKPEEPVEDPRINDWHGRAVNAYGDNDFFKALMTVDAGLKQFPGNEKLTALRAKIAAAKAKAELEEEETVVIPPKTTKAVLPPTPVEEEEEEIEEEEIDDDEF